jgi:4-amino-4-deoxy-L-arabinose transferase-like glycosyltransferase
MRRTTAVLLLGVLGWFILALFSMQFARLNLDEPWYLTASRLVISGKLPYRDFLFTQTPLLPYVYGSLLGMAGPSLGTGRFISVLLSTLAVALAMSLARRAAGNGAAFLTLLWLAVTPAILYYLVIVKTYALTVVLVLLALYWVFKEEAHSSSFFAFGSVLAAGLAAMTRISFAPIVGVLFLYWVHRGRWKEGGLAILLVAIGVLWFAYQSDENFYFDTVEYHIRAAGSLSTQGLVGTKSILISQIMLAFAPLVVLMLSLCLIAMRSALVRVRWAHWWVAELGALLVWLSSCLILLVIHLATWGNYWEYQVPVYVISVPLLAANVMVVIRSLREQIRGHLLIAAVVVLATLPSWFFQSTSFWDPVNTVALAERQSSILVQSGIDTDQVLGVYNHLALAARMRIPLGNEMGLFSVTSELPVQEAHERKFLTADDVTSLLAKCSPAFVVTGLDEVIFAESAPSRQLTGSALRELWKEWLHTNYRMIYKDDYNVIFHRRDTCRILAQ